MFITGQSIEVEILNQHHEVSNTVYMKMQYLYRGYQHIQKRN